MKQIIRILSLVAFCALIPPAARADNLVANGGFETGDFTGWTTAPAASGSLFGVDNNDPTTNNSGDLPHSGTYFAYFGGTTVGSYDGISQDLATVPGTTYQVSFWLANDDGPENDFQAYWGGNLILDVNNADPFGYTNYTFTETATSASTQLMFLAYQVPGYFNLDDVSVSSIPEPSSFVLAGIVSIILGGVSLRRKRRGGGI